MNYNNYSISSGKGAFYLKSKTPQEGYEEVTYGTEGKKTYHKYQKTVEGVLTGFDTKELEFEGKKLHFLEVVLTNGDDLNKISVPLKDSKNNYSSDARAIISSLNSADVNEEYSVSVYTKDNIKGDKTYKNTSIFFNYKNRKNEEGKNISTGFIPYEEIPKPIKDEDEDLGTTYDFKPVNKFYAQKIKNIKEKFTSSPTQPKEEPKKVEDEKDTLPF